MAGIGVRLEPEYTDDYITFVERALYQLGFDHIPASHITLIGSSMSATASLYMGLKHADKFGNIIAQAPSYANREILRPLMLERKKEKSLGQVENLTARIQLSCGNFDSLNRAQNLNLEHTKELAEILGSKDQPLPIHHGNYGHLMHCWSQELTETLPKLYRKQQELNSQTSKSAQSQKAIKTTVDSNTAKISQSSTIKFMNKGIASKERDASKKTSTDDITLQPTKAKKRAQKFAQPIEKERATSTDDSKITYGKRPRK